MVYEMSMLNMLLITAFISGAAVWAEDVDTAKIDDNIEYLKVYEMPVVVDTMSRIEPSFRSESGKLFGAFVTTAGVVSHFGGFPMIYYGVNEQNKTLIFGGLSAVILGIPLAGLGSDIAVNSAFTPIDANSITKSNWNAYKEGQLLTYGGIAGIILGSAMLYTVDSENDDENNYGAAGLLFVVIGSLATVTGIVQSEISIFKFSNSVINSYKSKNKIGLDANIMLINGSDNKWLPGIQAVISY